MAENIREEIAAALQLAKHNGDSRAIAELDSLLGEVNTRAESGALPEVVDMLQAEWIEQANRLADLFASRLGMSKEEYIASLPPFFPQPKEYKGRFDTPLIVPAHEGIDLVEFAKITGFDLAYAREEIPFRKQYPSDKGGGGYYKLENLYIYDDRSASAPTKIPYTVWVDDGANAIRMAPHDFHKNEARGTDMRGQSLRELLMLSLKTPVASKVDAPTASGTEFNRHNPYKVFGNYTPVTLPVDYGSPCLLDGQSRIFRTDYFNKPANLMVAGRQIQIARSEQAKAA